MPDSDATTAFSSALGSGPVEKRSPVGRSKADRSSPFRKKAATPQTTATPNAMNSSMSISTEAPRGRRQPPRRLRELHNFSQKWLRLSEQLSPIYKWTAGGFVTVQSCPRRRSALATNRPTRWATRGAPGELILCGQRHRWQLGKVVLVGREIGKAGVRSSGVVPAQVVGDVGARGAHAVVGLEVHALVL